MSATQAYLSSTELFKGVPLPPGLFDRSASDALVAVPRDNFNMKSQLAASTLGAVAELESQKRLLDYYTDRDSASRRGEILSSLLPVSTTPFAGNALARAAQQGLSLPSAASTANELGAWLKYADQYGQRARNLTSQATQGSWGGLQQGLEGLKSI
jgi:hypothetical protein